MPYKLAGTDVHKKLLMVVVVVVIDATMPEEKPERRGFALMPSDLRRLSTWLREVGVKEAVMGVDGLAIGVVGIGTAHAFALGPLQSCPDGDASMISRMPSGWCNR
jgi:hypothetical protein